MTDTSSAPQTPARTLGTAYAWDIATDRLEWQSKTPDILGAGTLSAIATGKQLEARIAPEHVALWRSAVAGATADAADWQGGVAYRVQFKFIPPRKSAGAAVWIEDAGRWWPAPDGRPARSRGILRVIDEHYLDDLRLELDHDADLTSERNRVRLLEMLGAVIGRAERTQSPSALFMVSLNALDAVNARLGHEVGDELLTAVARLLKSALCEGCAITRTASNTFAIVIGACGKEGMGEQAKRLIELVRNASLQTSAGPLSAAISIGGVALPEQSATGAEAISNALGALELAKQRPPGSFVAHTPADAAERTRKREQSVNNSLIAALEDNRILLVLQPIVEAASGKPALYEALARLRRTDGTLVSAADFIEEAEKLGLVRLIDRRALELAVGLLIAHPGLKLSLNISSMTTGDADWIATLRRLTERDPGLARRLIIEITETAMIHDIEEVRAFVALLRTLGCKTAIDDFGAGFTSFRHLKSLHIDMLKIDGIFVRNLPNDHQGRVLVKTMIEIANTFGLETVAEWVSDEGDAAFLREAGTTYLQGFLYGAPMPIEELIEHGLFRDEPALGAT